jgi:serine protease Do
VEPTPTTKVEIVPTPDNTTTPQGDLLTREQKSFLAHVTVRIWGAKREGDGLQSVYRGSGSIISPDGLILTNCHVANPGAMGYPQEIWPDVLIVELVDREDTPPVPTYLAEVMAFDPILDLAVIKITTTMDGTPLRASDLNLPYAPVGNSDALQFGDPVYIFGFPSIGGDTITFSTGNVSGFDTEEPIGNRAWIKTDATISGGNSGGLASNNKAEIIGVPTMAGTSSASKVADCRIIQDTNNDGVIDEKDTCIPIGGFINGIRPVNWAAPLITAAKRGETYVSPYETPIVQPTDEPPPQGDVAFTLNGWSVEWDANYCPVDPVTSFESGVMKITAVFSYSGMTNGSTVYVYWYKDGESYGSSNFDWSFGASGSCIPLYLNMQNGAVVPDGAYRVEVYVGDVLVGSAETTVGGVTPPLGEGVPLSGRVTDANTGKGIKDIVIAVLKPGVDPVGWTQDPIEADLYSFTQTDAQGYYTMPDLLQRGEMYGVVAGNNKIGYPVITGFLEVLATDTSIDLPLQLSK